MYRILLYHALRFYASDGRQPTQDAKLGRRGGIGGKDRFAEPETIRQYK